jgi:hypothetical protein
MQMEKITVSALDAFALAGIDPSSTAASSLAHHSPQTGTQFTTMLAQYAATPLFSPWPAGDQNMRSNPALSSAALNAHPIASNRREGRHARG